MKEYKFAEMYGGMKAIVVINALGLVFAVIYWIQGKPISNVQYTSAWVIAVIWSFYCLSLLKLLRDKK